MPVLPIHVVSSSNASASEFRSSNAPQAQPTPPLTPRAPAPHHNGCGHGEWGAAGGASRSEAPPIIELEYCQAVASAVTVSFAELERSHRAIGGRLRPTNVTDTVAYARRQEARVSEPRSSEPSLTWAIQ